MSRNESTGMTVFLTVSTLRQLPEALALGESVRQHHPDSPFVIGLSDDITRLPAHFQCPYPLLPVSALSWPTVEDFSASYNWVEFSAACKPLFMQTVWQTYPQADELIYLDPTVFLYQPLTDLRTRYADASILLTPHLLRPPHDQKLPDEKHLQNIGLYHAGFLGLRRTEQAERFLQWWAGRVPERAYVDFCESQCTDQIWLMFAPMFYEDVAIVKHPGWNVGCWNVHERTEGPIVFFNFSGLADGGGFFGNQNRFSLKQHPDVARLLRDYQQQINQPVYGELRRIQPAYGRQPLPSVLLSAQLPAWRRALTSRLKRAVNFVETVYVPRKM